MEFWGVDASTLWRWAKSKVSEPTQLSQPTKESELVKSSESSQSDKTEKKTVSAK